MNEAQRMNEQYAKVVLWEKGFAQYNEIIDIASRTRGNSAVIRKLNDSIRMMANADYDGLIDLLGNVWMVRRALINGF